MHRLLATAMAITVLAIPTSGLSAQAESLSSADRTMMLKDLEDSRTQFLASVNGLSEAQWRFKPDSSRWSIAEVAEHIVATDKLIGEALIAKLQPVPALAPDSAARIEAMIRGAMVDRSKRFNAPEMILPSGRWATQADLLAAFAEARTKTGEYLGTTRDPLRSRAMPHPAFGPLDGVQWIVLLTAHANRHVQQIEEVKRADGYPK